MSEIRVDPLRACARSSPPAAPHARGAGDPFAEGNEAQTPPELYAVRPDGGAPDTPGWQVRVFANRYPALEADAADGARDANADLFAALPGAARTR